MKSNTMTTEQRDRRADFRVSIDDMHSALRLCESRITAIVRLATPAQLDALVGELDDCCETFDALGNIAGTYRDAHPIAVRDLIQALVD